MPTVKEQKINTFFILEYALCGAIILATLLQKTALASAAFTVSFVALVIYFVKLSVFDGARHFLIITLLIAGISLLSLSFSSLLNGRLLTVNYLKEYFIFLSTLFFMFIAANKKINTKTAKTALIFNILIAYLYPIAYLFFSQKNTHNLLSLNFSNPNLTAMWIMQSVFYAVLAVILIDSKIIKIIAAVSVPLNAFLINETGARNTMLALALFALLCIFVVLKREKSFSKPLMLIINIIPIAFVPIYLSCIDSVQKSGWFDFWVEEGKNLTSRFGVWEEKFEKIKGLWLMGNYAESSGNAHNSHLVLLSSYGIAVLILMIYFLYKLCAQVNDEAEDKKNLFALAAFFAVIFMGLGEGALFSGGQGIFIMACGFLLLARCDYCGSEDEEEKNLVEQAVG